MALGLLFVFVFFAGVDTLKNTTFDRDPSRNSGPPVQGEPPRDLGAQSVEAAQASS